MNNVQRPGVARTATITHRATAGVPAPFRGRPDISMFAQRKGGVDTPATQEDVENQSTFSKMLDGPLEVGDKEFGA